MKLKRYTALTDSELALLMEIYAEGNEENAEYFFPDMERENAIRLVEQQFAEYLREDFFSEEGNLLYVLEAEGHWASALRLYPTPEGYYIEALETKPALRRRGYGREILRQVIDELEPPCTVRDCVSRKNLPSIRTHLAAGFTQVEEAKNLLDGTVNEKAVGMVYRCE